jgi:4-amino-4-deoxy-L-arabinose transferase-like glycosyltransferase
MNQSPPTSSIPGARPLRARRWLAAAVAVGLALRLAFAFGYWVGKPLTLDEQEYLILARSLAEGRGLTYPPSEGTAKHFERPPVYPLFLVGVLVAGGELGSASLDRGVPASLKIAQSLIGALMIWLIGLIAWRAAGPTAGAIAACLAAVYPPLVWIGAYVLSEALYALLALAAVWWLGLTIDRAGPAPRWPAVLAGLAAGTAVLTKESMIFFLIVSGAWLVARRRIAVASLLLVGALVVLAPWVARNARVHGQFVLGAPHGGVTFWTGNNPTARGEGDMAANPDIRRDQLALEAAHPGASVQQLDSIYYREALRFIANDPIRWLGLEARKAFFAVVPIGPSYRLHSRLYFLGSLLPYAALLPFAVAGLLRLGRLRDQPRALWLLVCSAFLVVLVFFPQERFRIPVIDPALIVCAAAWWALRPPVIAPAEAAR